MRVGALAYARLSSQRLPGKVLSPVGGRPVLGHVLARLRHAEGIDGIVVATSERPDDDPLVDWCEGEGVESFRGSLNDVLGRTIAAAEHHGFDAIARVNGDSPWIDPALIGEAAARLRESGCDFVTNLSPRSWPYGVSAEVASVEALRQAAAEASAEQREHVTAHFYSDPDRFCTINLAASPPFDTALRLTVDTSADLQLFGEVRTELGDRADLATTADVVEVATRLGLGSKGVSK